MSRKTIRVRDFEPADGGREAAALTACLHLEKTLKRQHFNEGDGLFYTLAEAFLCIAAGCRIDEIQKDWIPGIMMDVESRLT